jgi:hypothetical protein
MMVVGAIQAIASRSGNIWIKAFADLANVALIWFAVVPLYRYQVRSVDRGIWSIVLAIVVIVAVGTLTALISVYFGTTFRMLFETMAQGAVKP